MTIRPIAATMLALALSAAPGAAKDASPKTALDASVSGLLAKYHAAGAGVVVVRNYAVAWSGFYGEQAPGVPASPRTMFNGASLAKTVTAETVLRLVSAGKVSLDEPLWRFYVHPSLAADPRYKLLTPRLILSHRSGLLNWPYMYKDGKLAFVAAPGTRFGYSGIGYEILAHFLEKKLAMPFAEIVRKTVFAPEGVTRMAVARQAWMNPLVTTPMGADGKYGISYRTDVPADPDHPIRAWSAAADLFAAPLDYARFLIGVMRGDGVTPQIAKARTEIVSSFAQDPEWQCSAARTRQCPKAYGFGLGWMVFDYGDGRIVSNGGNDSGENALVYFSPQHPGSAVVVFMNGGGIDSVRAELDIIDAVDPDQKLTAFYRQLIASHLAARKK